MCEEGSVVQVEAAAKEVQKVGRQEVVAGLGLFGEERWAQEAGEEVAMAEEDVAEAVASAADTLPALQSSSTSRHRSVAASHMHLQ